MLVYAAVQGDMDRERTIDLGGERFSLVKGETVRWLKLIAACLRQRQRRTTVAARRENDSKEPPIGRLVITTRSHSPLDDVAMLSDINKFKGNKGDFSQVSKQLTVLNFLGAK